MAPVQKITFSIRENWNKIKNYFRSISNKKTKSGSPKIKKSQTTTRNPVLVGGGVDKSSNMYLIFFSMLSIVLFYLVILIDAHTRRTLPSVSCFRHFLFFQFKMKATGVLNNSPWRLFIQLQMFFSRLVKLNIFLT